MSFIQKYVSPLYKEILKVSGKKIPSLFVLIHLSWLGPQKQIWDGGGIGSRHTAAKTISEIHMHVRIYSQLK